MSRVRPAEHEYPDRIGGDPARELLFDLVSTPSPSGDEGPAAEVLRQFFEARGREAWIDAVGNVRAPGDDGVLLSSHIDTVPGDVPVEVKPGTKGDIPALWGRGTVDATGSVAAMAVAAIRTGCSFIGVVGEETDSRGAYHVVRSDRSEPDALINGEPSGWDGVTLGYRGLLAGRYLTTSESGHSSRPGNNAIQNAIEWWRRVDDAFASDEWTSTFERVTCKPIDIDAGRTDDGLSVEATMDVQFRIPPTHTITAVREIVDEQLDGGTVQWNAEIPPTVQSPRTNVARAFRASIRKRCEEPRQLRKTGTSDMNVFASAWGCPMVTYGPGESTLDHATNEHLELREYDRSIAVLCDVCERLLKG